MSIMKLTSADKRAIDNEINKINKGLEKLQSFGLSKTSVRNLVKKTVGYNVEVRENKKGQVIISRTTSNKQLFDYAHKMNNNGSQELHNIVSSININIASYNNNKALDLYQAIEDIKRKNKKFGIKQPNMSKFAVAKMLSTTNIQMSYINSATNTRMFDSDGSPNGDVSEIDDMDDDFKSNISNDDIQNQRTISDKSTFTTMTGKMRNGFTVFGDHYTPVGDFGFRNDTTGEFFDTFSDILNNTTY